MILFVIIATLSIHCSLTSDIIFTSGGTESNNMVLHTVVENFHGMKNATSHEMVADHVKPHIVTTSLEHDSIKLVLEKYQQQGKAGIPFTLICVITLKMKVGISDFLD